jgi:hypothetical protein
MLAAIGPLFQGADAIVPVHRWVNTPHRMHSNLVVRMVFPKVRTLNPAGSQSTLSAPFDGIRECSSSDTWAAPFAPQAGHRRSMVQLSRITIRKYGMTIVAMQGQPTYRTSCGHLLCGPTSISLPSF